MKKLENEHLQLNEDLIRIPWRGLTRLNSLLQVLRPTGFVVQTCCTCFPD